MSEKNVSLSIITVCYNSAKTIRRTIESVLKQENHSFQYYIIDGGSTDGTLDIIKAFEPNFKGRLKWISEPDKGIYDAFNKGIKMAKEDYIWFVNSDDYIEKDAVATIHQFIQKGQYHDNVLSFACNYVENDGTFILLCSSNQQKALNCFKKDYMGCPHPGVVVAKSIYESEFYFDTTYRICGDLDWFHRIYKANIPIVFSPKIISNFVNGGASTTPSRAIKHDYHYYFRKHYSRPFQYLYHEWMWHLRNQVRNWRQKQ